MDRLATDFPTVIEYQVSATRAWCQYAHLLRDTGRPSEALPLYDRAIAKLGQPAATDGLTRIRMECLVGRVSARVAIGELVEAIAEAEELTKRSNWNGGQLYIFACVYSVASGKIADKKEEYADRAMEMLQKAVKAGWKDTTRTAMDLAPLRDRGDFKKLLADLEKKFPPKKEVLPPPRKE